MNDVLGQAMHDYYFSKKASKLWIHNTYGEKEDMPVDLYFRDKTKMPRLEQIALQECKGLTLDIGAGAGSHALALQQRGIAVTAIDISLKAVEVMKDRGVINALVADIFQYNEKKFDTLLLLMNGIGLVANLAGLCRFLQHAKTLLLPGGQLIFDSSDVAYLYDHNPPQDETYHGEISYRYEYKKQKTDWFTWLYIDQKKLTEIASEQGWDSEVLFEDKFDQYLVKLTVKQ